MALPKTFWSQKVMVTQGGPYHLHSPSINLQFVLWPQGKAERLGRSVIGQATAEKSEGAPSGTVVKNLPAVQETQVWSLDREDPPEKGMATHSSILAGKSCEQRSPAGSSPWGCERQTCLVTEQAQKKEWKSSRAVNRCHSMHVLPRLLHHFSMRLLLWSLTSYLDP